MPLIYISLFWIAGIFAGPIQLHWLAFAVAGSIPLFLAYFLPDRRRLLLSMAVGVLVFTFGSEYYQWRLPENEENHLQFYNGQSKVELTGTVIRDPESTIKSIQLEILASGINLSANKVTGRVLVVIPKAMANYPYSYGDLLKLRGKLETPPIIEGFDYRTYLNNQGIHSIMYSPEVFTLAKTDGFKPLGIIYKIRESLSRSLARLLPEPQASLAQGIILGFRGSIPTDIENQFIRTGTAHLLAISGVNLTIMAAMLIGLFVAIFGRRYQMYAWLAIPTVWFYALITGFQPPVIRAAVMATIFLIGHVAGRQRNAVISLILAAALMISFSPRLAYDASFQLSAMSMAGLVTIAPPLRSLSQRWIEALLPAKVTKFFVPVGDGLAVSCSCTIGILPLIAFYFGIVSWTGPVATLLTVAMMPLIIMTGATCAILGIFILPLSQVIAWFVWLFLSYVLLVVNLTDYVPPIQVESFPYHWIFAYYATPVLIFWAYKGRRHMVKYGKYLSNFAFTLPLKPVSLSLFTTAVLLFATIASLPDNKLHVSFLDVGQGDAVLISRGNQQILLDGGPDGTTVCSQLSRHMPFWDRTIDLVISTHPHSDHTGGLIEVLKRYRVKRVLYPDIKYESPQVSQWEDLIAQKEIEPVTAVAGQRITLGSSYLQILNPSPLLLSGTESDIDNNGIVARLVMGKVSFLFMADTRHEAERSLVSQRSLLPSDVLKVGHHGSATSTIDSLLAVVNPAVAVISVGKNNKFGHPDENVLTKLTGIVGTKNIYRTDQRGSIEFLTDGNKLWVKTDR